MLTAKLKMPAAVGVPVIAPVEAFSCRPGGRAPDSSVNENGEVPAEGIVPLYGALTVPAGGAAERSTISAVSHDAPLGPKPRATNNLLPASGTATGVPRDTASRPALANVCDAGSYSTTAAEAPPLLVPPASATWPLLSRDAACVLM